MLYPAADTPDRKKKLRHQLVYEMILNLITENSMNAGDRLPSATELVKMSGVSLISVRHALDRLENEGRIIRQQGVGTFVAHQRIISDPSRPGGLLETLAPADFKVELSTELLRISTGFPNREVAQVLNLQEKDTVWEIVRLRRVRNSPSILEQAILPLTLVPVLNHQELSQGGSLYRFLREHYALIDDRTEQYFEVVRPSLMEQQELHLRRNEQIVRIRGVSLTSDGTAFDCWCQSYRAADFVFYTTSNRTGEILTLKDDIEWSIQNRKMKYKKNRRA